MSYHVWQNAANKIMMAFTFNREIDNLMQSLTNPVVHVAQITTTLTLKIVLAMVRFSFLCLFWFVQNLCLFPLTLSNSTCFLIIRLLDQIICPRRQTLLDTLRNNRFKIGTNTNANKVYHIRE